MIQGPEQPSPIISAERSYLVPPLAIITVEPNAPDITHAIARAGMFRIVKTVAKEFDGPTSAAKDRFSASSEPAGSAIKTPRVRRIKTAGIF
jgi:hypothetical protein